MAASSRMPTRRQFALSQLMLRSEGWKAELNDRPEPALHPCMADVFQEKVSALCRALENENGWEQARAALRGLLDRSPALRQEQQFVRRILVRFCLQIEASLGRGCHLDVYHVIHPKLDVEAPPLTEDPRDGLVG